MAPSSSSSSTVNYTITHHAPMERQRDQPGRSSTSSIRLEGHSREEARHAIVSSLIQILDQPLSMLRDGTVGDQQLAFESSLIPGSSVGKHLRHVHDHYRVLLDSLAATRSDSGDGSIRLDYDKRERIMPLETSVRSVVDQFERTQRRIETLLGGERDAPSTTSPLDQTVFLSATTPAEVELGSTLGRELWFVCLHAIHHYALARVILVHELGLSIDPSFGVAPSTMVMRLWRQASDRESKL